MSTKSWANQSIRVEHLVSPGPPINGHLRGCTCRCSETQTCPQCKQLAWPARISGRWDAEGGHTARPFDPVWVRLSCGCEFGNEALAKLEDTP